MRLEWSAFALADREGIFEFIEAENPEAAVEVDDRIQTQIEQLRQFPEMGRPGRVKGTRELVVSATPYVVAYCTTKKAVRILRILHGARLWPDAIRES